MTGHDDSVKLVQVMQPFVKFSSKIDPRVLDQLRSLSDSSGRPICDLLTESVSQYLSRSKVRPAFRSAANEVLEENRELLARLAK